MIAALRKFHAQQGGSAMTELVITTPVWIIIFCGLWDLAHFPVTGTRVQAQASLNMWASQLDANKYKLAHGHSNPAAGSVMAGQAEAMPSRAKFTGRESMTGPEGIAHAATIMGAGVSTSGGVGFSLQGTPTLTEAGYRSYMSLAAGIPDTYTKADEIIGEDQKYPLYVLDDNFSRIRDFKAESDGQSGLSQKAAAFIGGAISQSGSVLAITAGVRYGAVHGEAEEELGDHMTPMYDMSGIKPKSVYDTLVAPRPLQDNEADMVPWTVARLMAEGRSQYAVALRFGDAEWSDSQSPDLGGLLDETDEAQDDANEGLQDRIDACSSYPVPPVTENNSADVEGALTKCEKCLPGNVDCTSFEFSHCNAGDCAPPPDPP